MVLAHNISEGLRTQDVQISEDVTFDTMLLSPSTLEGLTNCGFYKPSPIQLHGIPLGKCGFDLLLEAKSGTGKTAVFTVIALEKLDLDKGVQTIILAPTREIAAQICDVISQIGSNLKTLNVEVVIGGLSVQEDIMKFEKKVHIVVGSPDLAARGIDASNVDLVINFEPPHEWQTYLHRIGRAGRFGSYGIAVTILSEGQEEIKFKNLIKSINGSLVLKNFWDEEDFDLHECDSSLDSLVYPDIENNDAYHELIDKLTNGDAKCIDETESFETLCNSFEMTKDSGIESFNDLLFSFKSQKENEEDPPNNNFNAEISAGSVPTLNILNNAPLKVNINTEVESTINNLKAQIKLLNNNQKNLRKREKKLSKPEVHEANIELLNETIVNGAPDQIQGINKDDNLYDHEYTESVSNKALLDAGLPTSFGSSKCSNNIKPKKKNTTNLNYNENKQYPRKSKYINFKETEQKKKPLPSARKVYNKRETEKIATETNSSSSEYDSKESIKNANLKHKSINYSEGRKHPQTNHNWDSHTKYAIWYNQLKTHIEQIQMALYIEELSKI
ncbi:hypothetical protein PYW08_013347 [Mythimna loreyi]|uniref:Uncharacterized protein n=1 Tax=Mythimna loreyi TaxID=667449 RepID=A0ACC2QFT1_9NEOP|nr:hypothetical protein PYW08_013347 [Mythimna loreyi]